MIFVAARYKYYLQLKIYSMHNVYTIFYFKLSSVKEITELSFQLIAPTLAYTTSPLALIK